MRLLLVVNSFASSVSARNTVTIHRRLSDQHEVEIVETNRRGHAIRFAQDAARRELDAVIAFGGDGTLNEVATGLAGSHTALGVLPGGSTNVFARTIGVPNDPLAAVAGLMDGLDATDVRPIGLGKVNGRYFCFHTGIGFDASVVAAVERHATLKRWLGHPLFMWSAMTTWAKRYQNSPALFEFVDDRGVPTPSVFTVVLNTNPYTYLGNRPINLAPEASLSSGLVAISFTAFNLSTIARTLQHAFGANGVGELDAVVESRFATTATARPLSTHHGIPFQVDGDYLGEVDGLDIEYVPDAIKVVWPSRAVTRNHPARLRRHPAHR